MNEHLLYASQLNTYYVGVDWTLIVEESTEHLLYRSQLNSIIIQELTEHLLYRRWLNTYYTGD